MASVVHTFAANKMSFSNSFLADMIFMSSCAVASISHEFNVSVEKGGEKAADSAVLHCQKLTLG